MKERVLIFITCLLTFTVVSAEKISEAEAIKKAKVLLPSKNFLTEADYRARKQLPMRQQSSKPRPFYIINAEDDGFVIVAGDDRVPEILGYSEHGSFDISNAPSNVRWWLEYYEKSINSIIEDGEVTSSSNILKSSAETKTEILPLITTTWGQGEPYNKYCPTLDGKQCLTGSVATAMAQIMHYWAWPIIKTPVIEAYTTSTNNIYMPKLDPDFFNWINLSMYELQRLMLYCGQSVKMDYGTDVSRASALNIANALAYYFDYSDYSNISSISREAYSSSEWENIIYDELQNGRPVIYCGQSDSEDQTFICCGYQEGKFYINWGWDGLYDGYFELSLLKPMNKENEDFSSDHMAIIGIEAPDDEDFFVHPDLHLFITLNKFTREATIADSSIDSGSLDGNSLVSPVDENYNIDGRNYWEHIVIPETVRYKGRTYTVTAIGSKAFNRTTQIKSVTLPESVRSIGDRAFYWCVNLESVNIPSHVKEIGSNTFTFCRKLKSVHLPDSIKKIGYGAFSDCEGLTEINIPSLCDTIADEAFKWCGSLHKVIIEDSPKPLYLGCLYDVGINYEPTMEDKIDGKPHYRGMFSDSGVNNLYLGRNVKFPTRFNIWVNPGLKICHPFEICWPYDPNWGGGGYRFSGPTYTSLVFGNEVTEIADSLFYSSTIKSTVVLPDKLKRIGDRAFSGINNVFQQQIEITIPETIEDIGEDAFQNSGLRFIRCNSMTPPELGSEYAFFTANYHDGGMRGYNAVIFVPEGVGNAYRTKNNWDNCLIIDPADEMLTINVRTAGTLYSRLLAQDIQLSEVCRLKLKGTLNNDDWTVLKSLKNTYDFDLSELNITELPDKHFYENASLVRLKLPNTLTCIKDSAFYSCEHLTGLIEIPETCSEIGKWAFYNTAVNNISYAGSIHVKDFAFRYCAGMEELFLHGDETIIDKYAFYDVPLKKVTIGKGVTVGEQAFFYNNTIEEVVFKDGVKKLGADAFSTCYAIKRVVFEGIINEIDNNPWQSSLDEVCISDIGDWCRMTFPNLKTNPLFRAQHFLLDGSEITDVVIPDDIMQIKDYSFYNRKNLLSVKLHNNITSIGTSAFEGCSDLVDLQLPSRLEYINSSAFDGCKKVESLDIPESILVIGEKAFNGCSCLKKIVAHWNNPITIESNTFSGVYADCYLYIPIGTSTKYFVSGWDAIPNVKEAGIMAVTVNHGGSIKYNDEILKEDSKDFLFTPYRSFYLSIVPDEGYKLVKLELNGRNILSEIEGNKLFIEEPEENFTLTVTFADSSIEQGDVNGDRIINVTDAIAIINYILKKSEEDFHDYWSDMNGDNIINVTDAILVVKKILDKNNN